MVEEQPLPQRGDTKMKKKCIALFGAMLLLVTLFAGCGFMAYNTYRLYEDISMVTEITVSPDVSEETEAPEDTEEVPGSSEQATSAHVQVHFATDELLSRFDSYHEFVEDPDGIQIVVTTEAPISDVAFTELQLAEDLEVVGTLYRVDELLPEHPLVITWMPQCSIPVRGISFTDTDNVFREFSIAVSGYDGSLILAELINQTTGSPRAAVTGILEAPEQAWTAIYVTENASRTTHPLSAEDAEEAHRILATMEAEEVLFPAHDESQQSDPMFILEIRDDDAVVATILTTETGQHFFRFTGTYGDHGDPGYVIGRSEVLAVLLSAYF